MKNDPSAKRRARAAASRVVLAVSMSVALGGCGAFGWVKSRFSGEPAETAAPAAPAPAAATKAAAPAPAPAAVDVADAVPRAEPLHPTANQWYGAAGRLFRPITDDRPFKERGTASVLGPQYEGKPTASGEPFAPMSMSAAHSRLPIPSYARVTNVRNGRTAIVRINDRGAYDRDEAIALSAAAAQKLALAGRDTVEVERLTATDIAALPPARLAPAPAPAAPAPAPEPPAPVAVVPPPTVAPQPAAPTPLPAPPPPAAPAPLPAPAPVAAPPPAPAPVAAAPPPPATRAAPVPAGSRGGPWSVQVGTFAVQSVAESVRARVSDQLAQGAADLPAADRTPRVERRGNRSIVLVGEFADRAGAEALADRLRPVLRQDVVIDRR
jgi:rare lipoprotein A